jgi:hypothetical protein
MTLSQNSPPSSAEDRKSNCTETTFQLRIPSRRGRGARVLLMAPETVRLFRLSMAGLDEASLDYALLTLDQQHHTL